QAADASRIGDFEISDRPSPSVESTDEIRLRDRRHARSVLEPRALAALHPLDGGYANAVSKLGPLPAAIRQRGISERHAGAFDQVGSLAADAEPSGDVRNAAIAVALGPLSTGELRIVSAISGEPLGAVPDAKAALLPGRYTPGSSRRNHALRHDEPGHGADDPDLRRARRRRPRKAARTRPCLPHCAAADFLRPARRAVPQRRRPAARGAGAPAP